MSPNSNTPCKPASHGDLADELKEHQRVQALRAYDILDSEIEEAYDSLTRIAAQVCGTQMSVISFIDEKRQWFKSHYGIDAKETPREVSFCTHAILKPDEVMEVKNATKDDRFKENPLVTGNPNIRFYAGAPLVSPEGYALGTICVIDEIPGQLSDFQKDVLQSLSRQAVIMLELRKKSKLLIEQKRQLEEHNTQLQKFAYVVSHDLRSPLNNISALSNIISENEELDLDEDSRKFLSMIVQSADSLKSLIDGILKYYSSDGLLSESMEAVALEPFLREVKNLFRHEAKITADGIADGVIVYTQRAALQQVLMNLISNGIKYNDHKKPEIDIRFASNESGWSLAVSDNGRGFELGKKDVIFDLFTTLGTTDRDNNKGTGIGLASVKKIMAGLQGQIEVSSVPGLGSTFSISFERGCAAVENY